jgi:hypothetical protein
MSGGSEEQPHDPGQVRGFHYWRRPGRSAANSHRRGRLLAGRRPTPADQPDRANRTAGVEVPYSGRPGRSWLATTRESPPSCYRRRSGCGRWAHFDAKRTHGLRPMVADVRPADGRATASRLPFPVNLNSGSTGGTSFGRTISAGGRPPMHSAGPHSESETPGVRSSAVDRAVAGGCAEDPCCRSAGTARLPRARAAGSHWLADSVDVASPWRTPLQ